MTRCPECNLLHSHRPSCSRSPFAPGKVTVIEPGDTIVNIDIPDYVRSSGVSLADFDREYARYMRYISTRPNYELVNRDAWSYEGWMQSAGRAEIFGPAMVEVMPPASTDAEPGRADAEPGRADADIAPSAQREHKPPIYGAEEEREHKAPMTLRECMEAEEEVEELETDAYLEARRHDHELGLISAKRRTVVQPQFRYGEDPGRSAMAHIGELSRRQEVIDDLLMSGKEYGPEALFTEAGLAENPKEATGARKVQMHMVPAGALVEVAGVFEHGASKYGSYNWRVAGIKLNTYTGGIMRHLLAIMDGQDVDPESGLPHLAHIAAGALIALDAGSLGKLTDDRVSPGRAAALLERLKS